MSLIESKARFEQFSDGVFAIAITLLAIELHVPHLVEDSIEDGIRELLPLLPNILTFALSFVTIAIFWVNHHQLTQTMGPLRRRVIWMNMLFLLFITLIPFATNVASINPAHPLAIMTFAAVLFAGSVSFTILRYYVHRSCGERIIPVRRSLVGPILYALAIATAPLLVSVSYVLLAVPPLFYFLPKERAPIQKTPRARKRRFPQHS